MGPGEDKTSASFLGRFGAWTKGAGGITITRFLKYLVLIVSLGLTLRVVFDGFSFYVARRDIDSELQAKKVSSLEYLSALSQRNRVLTQATLETRCLERMQLTLFRILDGELAAEMQAAFQQFIDQKGAIIAELRDSGRGLIDVDRAVKFVNSAGFAVGDLDSYLTPLPGIDREDDKYKKLATQIEVEKRKYIALGARDHAALRKRAEDEIRKKTGHEPWKYLTLDAVQVLEARQDRLRTEREKFAKRAGDAGDVMVRYGVWTDALTGGLANSSTLDEAVRESDDDKPLASVDCDDLKRFYQAVAIGPKEPDGKAREPSPARRLSLAYSDFLLGYFSQPPAAQTLFVTMFLGALGALTVNVLRLSNFGWWAREKEPLWGEVIVSPLLGALAAFGIFLIGSAGLLLTTDMRAAQNGVSPLSAFFIGLLGFVSGLLYDEAFARVRRVGSQLFSADRPETADNARQEDRAFAQVLTGVSASLAAGLVRKYGIGTRLALEPGFTLLVPSDEAMGNLNLKTWTAVNDDTAAFEHWFHRHHAGKRIAKADVAGEAAVKELEVDEGPPYVLTIDDGQLKIGNARVLVADVPWKNGIIQVLREDVE